MLGGARPTAHEVLPVKSYQRECQGENSSPSARCRFFSRHSAQPFEEWSSSDRKVVVSACEAENQFFFPVVPFHCCDGANGFLKRQA
jgi:hypothetical protein